MNKKSILLFVVHWEGTYINYFMIKKTQMKKKDMEKIRGQRLKPPLDFFQSNTSNILPSHLI